MRILVSDIAFPDAVRDPIAAFLGIEPMKPAPEYLIWRGHEVIIKHGISLIDALRIRPDFVFGLMCWYGIEPPRAQNFYEFLFNIGVPVFTWGNDSYIPKLMVETKWVERCEAPSERILFARPEHPILHNVRPEEIVTSKCDVRRIVPLVRGDIGLAYDPDNSSWEIIYLEEWFGNHRWLHYHPYPEPPDRLIDNFLTYMTRPKDRTTLPMIASPTSGLVLGGITQLITKRLDYSIGAGLIGTVIGAVARYYFGE